MSSLLDIVRDVKSRSTRVWWRHKGNGPLWQRSFHDRGIRTMRDFENAATYVLINPVRADPVEEWKDYPFHCGTVLNG